MCGIFGHYCTAGADRGLVERMAQCLSHRGPDGYGTAHTGPLAFGAGRLAIIDLEAPAGPIPNEDGRVSVVFNGEIYNYRSLRRELEQLGHHFATQTDTEVIVHGYETWGRGVLDRLRGMFGLGIWDAAAESLLLARDRTGEKPLYYTYQDGALLFASEIKALWESSALPRAVDQDSLANYLLLGYTAPPQTLFRGISKLRPGEWLLVDRHGYQTGTYYQPPMNTLRADGSFRDQVRAVRRMLFESVEMRLMSDVPVGAFLSGGVDSTAVVAIMQQMMSHPVQTFTVGFDTGDNHVADAKFNVDARHAAEAAAYLHTDHRAITMRQDSRLAELLPHLVYALDEPVAEQAIFQTAYVAALARVSGIPVMLSGDAGDELFAGYAYYRSDQILEQYLTVPAPLRQWVTNPLLEKLPKRYSSLRGLASKSRDTGPLDRFLTWKRIFGMGQLPGLLRDPGLAASAYDRLGAAIMPLLNAPQTTHFTDRLAYAGLTSWVAEDSNMRVDKMCMSMSIEARAPFQDHRLVELALGIPLRYKLRQGDFKVVLKEAVRDLVPASILNRPKWGFIPPLSDWLRTILRPLIDTYLAPERVEAAGLFNPAAVTALVDSHLSRRGYEAQTLWSLLVFHLWHALYIDQSLVLSHKLTPHELVTEFSGTPISFSA